MSDINVRLPFFKLSLDNPKKAKDSSEKLLKYFNEQKAKVIQNPMLGDNWVAMRRVKRLIVSSETKARKKGRENIAEIYHKIKIQMVLPEGKQYRKQPVDWGD